MSEEFYPLLIQDGHIWGRTSVAGNYIVCKTCGVVMKRDGRNAPCGGVVKIFPRNHKPHDNAIEG